VIQNLFSLEGRVAVIAGGSGGIGRGAAALFLDLGASVILTGKTQEHIDDTLAALPEGAPVTAIRGDARDDAHVDEIFDAAARVGGVDVVVNCVGTQRRKPILEATSEDLDLLWSVNVASVFAMTQRLIPQMVEKGYGKIINLCSIGSFVGLEQKTMYAITKGALLQYTRSSAIELAPYGIRVNALAPGYVETPMTYDWIHSEREGEYLAAIPLGRFATVEDLNGAFAFLAGRASDHVTGQMIVIDGGETVW
jgi:NAD(P)-dependent dehydrogenase (short-subunit alcohol dehydrogenase family)